MQAVTKPESKLEKLIVVMPVFNEEAALAAVVSEWVTTLRSHHLFFEFFVIDDGSTDQSSFVLKTLATQYNELRLFSKTNTGHGQTCLFGYQLALENGATFVFQIDSDGQCDPRFFMTLWSLRDKHKTIFGYRKTRDDGFERWVISRFVSVVTLLAARTWVPDANVPYRLIDASSLVSAMKGVPNDFYLANILLAVWLKQISGIYWVPIHFRDRIRKTKPQRLGMFFKQGMLLFRQLLKSSRRKNGA